MEISLQIMNAQRCHNNYVLQRWMNQIFGWRTSSIYNFIFIAIWPWGHLIEQTSILFRNIDRVKSELKWRSYNGIPLWFDTAQKVHICIGVPRARGGSCSRVQQPSGASRLKKYFISPSEQFSCVYRFDLSCNIGGILPFGQYWKSDKSWGIGTCASVIKRVQNLP